MYQWREKYGDIVSVNTFGIPMIFIYSDKIANDLLAKSGASYSDRPSFIMIDLLGWSFNFAFSRYGDWWRRHVRTFNQFFNSKAVSMLEPAQLKSRRLLLQRLLETPAEFNQHIKFCIGRVIMDVTYGIEIKSKDDPFISMAHHALEGLSHALLYGIWLVDAIPILRYILEWIPGLPTNRFIKKYRKASLGVVSIPFDISQNRTGPDQSFVSSSFEKLHNLKNPLPDEEIVIRNTAGIAYAAGMVTTYSAFSFAMVASILFPDAQKKLQIELDQVLGDCLPTLGDRINLPYTRAFCAEVMRWRPGVPLGVPHAALEDGVYGEYFIPKGSIIVADSWQILRGEKYGPNPEDFNPERFLRHGGSVPVPTEQFGFGRRACPGRFLAYDTFFLLVASVFKVFNIAPMKDENGQEIPISDEVIPSAIIDPIPFKCSITPRSSLAKELILRED